MAPPARRKFGTGTRRAFDMARIREGLKGAGIDTRTWVSYGTVGTIDDDGEFNPEDPQAIHIDPNGVTVDVLLQPTLVPLACRYSGIQGGSTCTVYAPIKPGDEVLVLIPEGDMMNAPLVVAILNAAHSKLPTDPVDRKPFFRNDRLSIVTRDVPIDIRTTGGSRIEVKPDGTVIANEGTLGVARKTDPVQVLLSDGIPTPVPTTGGLVALATALLATGVFTPSGAGPFPQPDFAIAGAITKASKTVKAGGVAE